MSVKKRSFSGVVELSAQDGRYGQVAKARIFSKAYFALSSILFWGLLDLTTSTSHVRNKPFQFRNQLFYKPPKVQAVDIIFLTA